MTTERSTAGSAYGAFIAEQLSVERARKASIEARGLSVITTSGALVTLLFALGSLVSGADSHELPTGARWLLISALFLFLGAAIGGIVANFPLRYREVAIPALRSLTQPELWNRAGQSGTRRLAEAAVNVLERARDTNAYKVRALLVGLVLEVGAVVAVAGAVGVILWP